MRSLFRALSALLILVVIALVAALITMRLALHKAEVRVPQLIGLPVPEAVIHLHRKGLQGDLDGQFFSRTQPAGRVLTQSPPPGTQVRKSWRVRFAVSLGPQKTAIPQLDGMDESIAAVTIQRIGLKIGDVASMPYPYAPENTVVAQTPEAHTQNAESPKISLLVAEASTPPEPASVMPDLIGENFTTAALAVVRAGFALAPIETPASGSVGQSSPPGAVIAQSPPMGSRILPGATIQLTIQP